MYYGAVLDATMTIPAKGQSFEPWVTAMHTDGALKLVDVLAATYISLTLLLAIRVGTKLSGDQLGFWMTRP